MELYLGQVALVGGEGAVVGRGIADDVGASIGVLVAIGGGKLRAAAEVVVAADASSGGIGNQATTIDTVLIGAAKNVAVEHTVDHGGTEVGVLVISDFGCAGVVVVTHDASSSGGGTDVGVAVAVDDARVVLKAAYDAAGAVARGGDTGMSAFGEVCTIGQDAAVVDAAIALGHAGNGTHVGS